MDGMSPVMDLQVRIVSSPSVDPSKIWFLQLNQHASFADLTAILRVKFFDAASSGPIIFFLDRAQVGIDPFHSVASVVSRNSQVLIAQEIRNWDDMNEPTQLADKSYCSQAAPKTHRFRRWKFGNQVDCPIDPPCDLARSRDSPQDRTHVQASEVLKNDLDFDLVDVRSVMFLIARVSRIQTSIYFVFSHDTAPRSHASFMQANGKKMVRNDRSTTLPSPKRLSWPAFGTGINLTVHTGTWTVRLYFDLFGRVLPIAH